MRDRVDPPNQAFRRGPWPEVTDLSRIYDHGQPVVRERRRPLRSQRRFPDAQRHAQGSECHSREALLDRARRDLDGDDV